MPAGGPPDPWKLHADFFDAIDEAEDMEDVARLCTAERATATKSRSIADAIEEEYPPPE